MNREWLENYIAMARECELRQERLARMKSAEVLPPLRAGNDGSQHTGSSGEHMARSVEKRLEYEEQIAPILAENRRRMRAVEHAVCTLPPRERDILRMRYMDSDTLRPLPWRDIATKLFGTDEKRHIDAALRIHRAALAHYLTK